MIVSNQNKSRPSIAIERQEQLKNMMTIERIEVAGRLVCQKQLGIICKCAGNCHSLLLATRKLGRIVVTALVEAHFVKQRLSSPASSGRSPDFNWHDDVLEGGE